MNVSRVSVSICIVLLVVTHLAACGGGGSGGGSGGGGNAGVSPAGSVVDTPPSTAGLPPMDSPREAAAEQPASTPYAGSWRGTFSGTDSGTWEARIAPNGTVTATGVSRISGSFDARGTVSATGEFTLTTTGSASTGATFRGNIADGRISGTWRNFGGAGGGFTGAQTSTLQASATEPRPQTDEYLFDHLAFDVWLEEHALDRLVGDAGATVDSARAILRNMTPAETMPRTGSASYVGNMAAIETVVGADATSLHGPFVATADFDRGLVAGNADLARIDDGAAWGNIQFNDSALTGNGFNGRAVSSNAHEGAISGRFGGVAANEMAGIVSLEGPTRVHGVFAGQQP